jgi:CDP-glucose 4,6-dehydratase
MFDSYFKDKKVFVTGHTGFKGSWLLVFLHLLNAKVKGYALEPPPGDNLYNVIDGNNLCESDINDINDLDHLKESLASFKPDIVLHLAAQPLVRLSYQKPIQTYQTNVMGTANLLEAVRQLEHKCEVVCITTDKVYENKEWYYPYRETDRLGGYDPYSSSKACAEILISSYRQSFFNPNEYANHNKSIASARAGNVIGGGDWAKDRIIPDIVKALTHNQPVEIRNPNAIRPWQHVIEPLAGYLKLAKSLNDHPKGFSDAWNFGPQMQDRIAVGELVKLAIDEWGSGSYQIPENIKQPHEAGLLMLDVSKTVKYLEWKPTYSSSTAITQTIRWYKAVQQNKNPLDVCISQIEDYMQDVSQI